MLAERAAKYSVLCSEHYKEKNISIFFLYASLHFQLYSFILTTPPPPVICYIWKSRRTKNLHHLQIHWLCGLAAGSWITVIWNCSTSIKISLLHFGQNTGKLFMVVSALILSRVLLPHNGHNIQSISFIFFPLFLLLFSYRKLIAYRPIYNLHKTILTRGKRPFLISANAFHKTFQSILQPALGTCDIHSDKGISAFPILTSLRQIQSCMLPQILRKFRCTSRHVPQSSHIR